MNETSSIDELLSENNPPSMPKSPEIKDEINDETADILDVPIEPELTERPEPSSDEPKDVAPEEDDYGNPKPIDNEIIRERLKKQAESMQRKHQAELDALRAQLEQAGASQQVQQAAKNFEYNPNADGDWQQQLAQFVRHTVTSMTQEQQQRQAREQEHRVHMEFESRFRNGMTNFTDFVDVVESLPVPISDAMTLATRAMQDPAAFIYAAAKKQPKELERIARINDPYVQMVEMGRLEERMRKNKTSTSAPKPLEKTLDDAGMPHKSDKEPTIEQMIAQSQAKKLAQMKLRRGSK